jgi:hypothetical protein
MKRERERYKEEREGEEIKGRNNLRRGCKAGQCV